MKKLLILLVVLSLTSTLLFGCGKENETTKSSGDQVGAKKQSENQEVSEAKSEKNDVVEMEMLVNHTWWPLKEFTGSVPEEITKRTGVRLKTTVAMDGKQLPLLVTSGDLPELIFTDNSAEMINILSNSDLCYSWDELIEKYAPDFDVHATLKAVNTAPDGKFYTIKNNFSTKDEWDSMPVDTIGGSTGIAFRKDMLEELGNPKMETLDDFVNILSQVKEKYPDMVPLVMDMNWKGEYFKNALGSFPVQDFELVNDQLVHYLNNPITKDFYMFMNKLYRKGLIIAENYSFKDDKRDDEFALGGKAFAIMHMTRTAEELNAKLEKQGADFRFTQLTHLLSDSHKHLIAGTGWSGVFITKKCKDPEKAIKMMQFLFSEEGQRLALWGLEGKHWELANEGYPKYHYELNDEDFIKSNGLHWWGLMSSSAVTEILGKYVPNTEATKASAAVAEAVGFWPEIGLVKTEPESEEAIIKSKIREMEKVESVKVILAETEDEANKAYEKLIELANRIGIEQYESWAQGEYDKVKDLFK